MRLVAAKKVPLPLVIDPVQKEIIERVCSLENLGMCRNKTIPIEGRLQEFLAIHQAIGQLLKAYLSEAVLGAPRGEELTRVMIYLLHLSAVGVELVDEFMPTIRKDETYEARMNGLAKMKKGLANIFSGMYTSIAIDEIYSDAQRLSMLKSVAATAPQFGSVMSDGTKTEFARKYTNLKERFRSENDQALLDEIVLHLNGKQNPEAKPRSTQP